MKKTINIPVILALGLVVLSAPLRAQLNESINVNSTLFRQLEKATRPGETPAYKDTSVAPPKLSYSNVPAFVVTTVTPTPITQANLKMKEKLNRLYQSYVKMGFGNYTNFLGEFTFNAGRSRDYDYGISYKHFSSLGGIDDVAHSGFSNDAFTGYGQKLWDKIYGTVSVGYERNQLHYYGFDRDLAFSFDSVERDKKDYRQVYNIPHIMFEVGTWKGDTSKLRHKESLLYRPFFDRYQTSEHYIAGTFSGGKYRNHEYYSLDASFDVNAYQMKDSSGLNIFYAPPTIYTYTSKHTNGIIRLNPSVNTNFKQLKLRVGVTLAMNAEDDGARFHFYPDIDLSYSLFKNMFIPYIRVGGNLQRNSLYTLTRENPFVLNSVTPPNTNNKIELSGGFKGSFGSRLSFNVGAGYSVNENYLLFMPDLNYSFRNRFTVVTDNVNILRFGGQMLFQSSTKWHILATGNYYIYETRDQLKAWHKPDFDGDVTLVYNLGDKLIGRFNTSVVGTRHVMPPEPFVDATEEYLKSLELKPYVDADLQVEYRYTTRFSVFINVNNIASQRYLRWYNYPMQRFNVLGGLTYSF